MPITIICRGLIVTINLFELFYLIIRFLILRYLIKLINKEEENKNYSECWIPFEQLKQIHLIANGGFGRVFKAQWNDRPRLIFDYDTQSKIIKNGREVAIKYITCSNLSEFHAHILCIKSNSVVPLLGISRDTDTNEFILVMKYAQNGNLNQYLSRNPNLSWKKKIGLIVDIATGLADIHRAGLIHADFHSGNILISAGGKALISDLGLSRSKSLKTCPLSTVLYGVISYIAPELIRCRTSYTQAADVYSFGIVLSEICSGLKPYNDSVSDMFLLLDVCHRELRPKIHPETPDFLVSIIKSCWDGDHLKRPSMELVLKFVRNLYINFEFHLEIPMNPSNNCNDPGKSHNKFNSC
ncbi:kinase-like domain-containing protein [Glomus cerebriforme]|uniref:Kinase-like domain-containing protein n=1 Tax=Glomus cerebriforme TaxID=658196 RepID=A0A397TJN8_9GLOM|nr:kinase-like domain-containing protein [Glomus cerebriforme]